MTDNPNPSNPYGAKFSVQYCVARAFLDGSLSLTDFAEDRIHEPSVREFMARVSARLDPSLDARYPREFPAEVHLVLRDGRKLNATIFSPKGDPEAPLTTEELGSKFRSLLANTTYRDKTSLLLQNVVGLERQLSVLGLLSADHH